MNKTIDRIVGFKNMVVYGTTAIRVRTEKERLERAINQKYGIIGKVTNDPERALALEEVKQKEVLLKVYKDATERAWKSFID